MPYWATIVQCDIQKKFIESYTTGLGATLICFRNKLEITLWIEIYADIVKVKPFLMKGTSKSF